MIEPTSVPIEGTHPDEAQTPEQKEVLAAHDEPMHYPGEDIAIPSNPPEYQPDEENEEFEALRRTDSNDITETVEPEPTYWSEAAPVFSTQDPQKRPAFILSEVDTDHPNGGIVIGWDTCGRCHSYIRQCSCSDGPARPSYVDKWRKQQEEYDKKKIEQAAATEARKAALVVANTAEVEAAVEATLATPEELTPTGRKKRSDAGKKRGPRKKGDVAAMEEAAGNLASAMTKET